MDFLLRRIRLRPNRTQSVVGRSAEHHQIEVFQEPDAPQRIALAGAQTTIEAWKREKVPPVENDGILTAPEAVAEVQRNDS